MFRFAQHDICRCSAVILSVPSVILSVPSVILSVSEGSFYQFLNGSSIIVALPFLNAPLS